MKTSLFISALLSYSFFLFTSCSVLDKLKSSKQPLIEVSTTSVATQNLINELRLSDWMKSHFEKSGKRPILMVGNIQTKGMTDVELIKIHERELAKHGQFRVIRAYFHRKALDKWISMNPDQSDVLPLRWAKSQGADFILMGSMNKETKSEEKDSVLKLTLISIEKQDTVWKGESVY